MIKRTFTADVYNCLRGFQMPRKTARELKVWSKSTVHIVIRRGQRIIYKGLAPLTSGTEIRTGDAVKALIPGERIRVAVSA